MAREVSIKPNVYQKLIHRFLMLRSVSAFLAHVLPHADSFMLWLTRGKHTVAEIVGLPIIQLTTKGAKTGQLRTVPLVIVAYGETLGLIASNFGGRHAPGWYYNLKAHPECEVKFKGNLQTYIARETGGDEYLHFWLTAVSLYGGYAKYKERAAHRHIPVMVLELKK
jgi:deazaflavin-dependent oxidoreductase (nitroreductase family)